MSCKFSPFRSILFSVKIVVFSKYPLLNLEVGWGWRGCWISGCPKLSSTLLRKALALRLACSVQVLLLLFQRVLFPLLPYWNGYAYTYALTLLPFCPNGLSLHQKRRTPYLKCLKGIGNSILCCSRFESSKPHNVCWKFEKRNKVPEYF